MYVPSKYMQTPSFRRHGLRWRTMTAGKTFFLRSGFPFFTVAITMSPTQAEGRRFKRPLIPFTEMMQRFFAPVLSAQFTVAATGRPSDMRNLFPAEPPRPRFDIFLSLSLPSYPNVSLFIYPKRIGFQGFHGLGLFYWWVQSHKHKSRFFSFVSTTFIPYTLFLLMHLFKKTFN